jgi:FliI/YscN family ATPase
VADGFALGRYLDIVLRTEPLPLCGRVVRTVGLVVESNGPRASVGELCLLQRDGLPPLPMEVVGFREGALLTVPLGGTAGIRPGDRLVARGTVASASVGDGLLGRVVDGLGVPLDGQGSLGPTVEYPLQPPTINPLAREPIAAPLGTGVRAIDALLTCGKGQRIGVFGGSGVGKSTLLGMMAKGTEADVAVIALIGERGREVRSFLEHDLGPEGLKRSVVVVSTSDSPPLVRLRAAFAATSIAEYFRDQGKHVLLMMDSVTRFAMAQREVGLAAGEPPTAKGYPPSVFAMLPSLLERAGNLRTGGGITGFYTVLVEGDDHSEPIADGVRAILDGHIVLSRELGARNHYPAIEILPSVSRTMPDVTRVEHRIKAGQVRDWMSAIKETEDLVSVGAYLAGSNPRVDEALAKRDRIEAFLKQPADMRVGLAESIAELQAI